MRAFQKLFGLLALAVSLPACAQTTNITLAKLYSGGSLVASGRVCATPADQYGSPISLTSSGYGLVLPTPAICASVVNGALPNGLPVPDAHQTNSVNPIFYNISVQVLSPTGSQVGLPTKFTSVPNITGASFALDTYTPQVGAVTPAANYVGSGPGVPASCASPSLWLASDTAIPYICHNGTYQAVQGQPGAAGPPGPVSTTNANGTNGSFFVGTGPAISQDPMLRVSRIATGASAGGYAHGLTDDSTFQPDSVVCADGHCAYAAHDCRVTLLGSLNTEHLGCFQSIPQIPAGFTGTLNRLFGVVAYAGIGGGTVNNLYDFYVNDAVRSGGNLVNQVGVYIPSLSAGSATNYALKIDSNPSLIGGTLFAAPGRFPDISGFNSLLFNRGYFQGAYFDPSTAGQSTAGLQLSYDPATHIGYIDAANFGVAVSPLCVMCHTQGKPVYTPFSTWDDGAGNGTWKTVTASSYTSGTTPGYTGTCVTGVQVIAGIATACTGVFGTAPVFPSIVITPLSAAPASSNYTCTAGQVFSYGSNLYSCTSQNHLQESPAFSDF